MAAISVPDIAHYVITANRTSISVPDFAWQGQYRTSHSGSSYASTGHRIGPAKGHVLGADATGHVTPGGRNRLRGERGKREREEGGRNGGCRTQGRRLSREGGGGGGGCRRVWRLEGGRGEVGADMAQFLDNVKEFVRVCRIRVWKVEAWRVLVVLMEIMMVMIVVMIGMVLSL
eukprot:413761-Rhodomonas_salina.2